MNNIDFIELKRKGDKVEFTATDEQIKQLANSAHDLLCINDAIQDLGDFITLNSGAQFNDNHVLAFGTILKELGQSMRYKVVSKLASEAEEIYLSLPK